MPAWSPDGRRIAYARRAPGTTSVPRDDGLWVIDADGAGRVQVLPPATGTQLTQVFGWTADGGAIAFGLLDGTKQTVLFSFRIGGASFTDFSIRAR